ncbi:UDP-4-amino-4,6-dideoxy-N-acetyl-beta-L-altrosamine transaminase [Candidatus Dependentiae bacterium]|nr:UDP-4-amino-4,6-dideoxy-N-acetyl-beta-L-altrosamine transaminase [Candidatus Dependentiae bacterium]
MYNYGSQSISLRDIWEVVKVLRSNWLTQGPKVKEFEKAICDYTNAKYCVAVANGAAALHLSMLSLNIKNGDEFITTPNTFVASSNSILYAGGKVQFADIEPTTANIDPVEIEKKITSKTKGIIPVHFAGQSCDMQKIYEIATNNNLFVIEDAAQALGSEYKKIKVGNCKFSDLTIFSFHPVKNITTGEGGAITTNNKELYEKILMLRTHGITKDFKKFKNDYDGSWYYEQHHLGFNYRISDMQCALGISQLKQLDKFIKRRREIVETYRREFYDDNRFNFLEEKDYSRAAWHLCPLLINFENLKTNKKELFEELKKNGLNLQVHYIPVHLQPYYQSMGFKKGDFSVSENFYKRTISLPIYVKLKNNDIKKIVKIIKRVVK